MKPVAETKSSDPKNSQQVKISLLKKHI